MTFLHLIGRRALVRHADSPETGVRALEVEISTADGRLRLHFRLLGDLAGLVIPAVGAPARADELWRHTCFEAFVSPAGSSEYVEYNFSPSRAWAAYHFGSYRAGRAPLEGSAPDIDVRPDANRLDLRAAVDLGWLAGRRPWRLGVTAVLEDRQGRLSYWALQHAPGKADFHRAETFVVDVP